MFIKKIRDYFRDDEAPDRQTLGNLILQTQNQISALELKIDVQSANHELRLEAIEALLRRYLFLIEDLE